MAPDIAPLWIFSGKVSGALNWARVFAETLLCLYCVFTVSQDETFHGRVFEESIIGKKIMT